MTSDAEPFGRQDEADRRAEPRVLAAGGVVLDRRGRQARILVVHRPAYGDWSLPKGHVDAGEDAATAALREVAEETGVAARILGELDSTEYRLGPVVKRVRWFLMARDPDAKEPDERTADREVDVATWWDANVAQQRLTHEADRALIRSALASAAEAS
jgi:8-oxo-dGTP diphosphatase